MDSYGHDYGYEGLYESALDVSECDRSFHLRFTQSLAIGNQGDQTKRKAILEMRMNGTIDGA